MSTQVVLLHDAAIDEYVSFMLLAAMEDVELAGTVVVNADCIGGPAMQVQWRIQELIGRTDLPLGLSSARGLNPFPWPYRGDCVKLGAVPALDRFGARTDWPPYPNGDAWLRRFFESLDGMVTVVCLCPLAPLATLFEAVPGAAAKVERLVWMGGAIDVAGNLDPATLPEGVANPYAEWNVFWDPPATQAVLSSTEFPITMFPLDVTNTAPVSKPFLARLLVDGKSHSWSNFARQGYALVADEAFYDMWDVTACAWLARPDLYEAPQQLTVSVATSGDKEGAILPDAGGREVEAILAFANLDGFYDYVAETLRSGS
jgi:purine nucleosidase